VSRIVRVRSNLNFVLFYRAKFQPYDALRQRFWAQYLMQYDADDTGALSHLEITSMLDSLGSTLSAQTVDSFFIRYGKRPADDELTIPEVTLCLETELCRPKSEKKRLNTEDSFADSSSSPTPLMIGGEEVDGRGSYPGKSFLDGLNFSGPPLRTMLLDESPTEKAISMHPLLPEPYMTEPSERPLIHVAEPLSASSTTSSMQQPFSSSSRQFSHSSSDLEDGPSGSGVPVSLGGEQHFERVINVKNCPLCHRPRLNSKAEMDIITHLAICASQDWAKVDRIVVSNFVTASQAQRKWYTKVITKVSNGNYKLGAVGEFLLHLVLSAYLTHLIRCCQNSANIIVQNRMTGQLEEEKMQVYIRLGIRLLYKVNFPVPIFLPTRH
jgi:phosphatidylserine decarboxylase